MPAGFNFNVLLFHGTFINVSRLVASPHLVLPFLYIAIGAPAAMAGVLLPIVQFSRLVSQVLTAPLLDNAEQGKWFMTASGVLLALALATVGLAMEQESRIFIVVIFLTVSLVIGIGQGISGLANQRLLSTTLPISLRSRLLFSQTAIAGAISLVIAWVSSQLLLEQTALRNHLNLLWAGVIVSLVGGVCISLLREPRIRNSSGMQHTGSAWKNYKLKLRDGVGTVIQVAWFRKFVIARLMLLSVELATPFYAIHAALIHSKTFGTLSSFVIAASLGVIVGSLIWSKLSHRSIRTVILVAPAMAVCGGLISIWIEFRMAGGSSELLHSFVFFLVAMGTQGVISGRKVYLANIAPIDLLPYYTAVSNTLVGLAGIGMALGLGVLAQAQHVVWPLFCLVSMNLLAIFFVARMLRERG